MRADDCHLYALGSHKLSCMERLDMGSTGRAGVCMVVGQSGEQCASRAIPASEVSQGSEEEADL